MVSMKDLLNTSLVSKRWCNLWHLRRNLNFDQLSVLGSDEDLRRAGYIVDVLKNGETCEHLLIKKITCEHLRLDVLRDEFMRRVDQFVKNFKGEKVDSFVVQFNLNLEESNTIDQWIQFAISKGVGRIDLLFLQRRHHNSSYCYYKFPFGLFSESNNSTLKHMHLRHCLLCHPTNSDLSLFRNLLSLVLVESHVDETLFTSLFSNCMLLKKLSLIYCQFKSSTLKIASSSLCCLKLHGYGCVSDTRPILFSLDCLKLTSVEFGIFYLLDCISINAPVLKKIYHHNSLPEIPDVLARFATLPHLEILTLLISYPTQVNISLEDTAPLTNLKKLDLCVHMAGLKEENGGSISWILTILQTCPVLQKLSVMLLRTKSFTNHKDIQDHGMSCHNEIKVIEMGGCVGNWYEIEFVKNVLKYTNKLERIVLSPYRTDGLMHDSESHSMWFQKGRERTREMLSEEIEIGRTEVVLI